MGDGRNLLFAPALLIPVLAAARSSEEAGGRVIGGQDSNFHRTQFLSRVRTVSTIR